jgi:hypothetical protein
VLIEGSSILGDAGRPRSTRPNLRTALRRMLAGLMLTI